MANSKLALVPPSAEPLARSDIFASYERLLRFERAEKRRTEFFSIEGGKK